jgi:hypothetical protein
LTAASPIKGNEELGRDPTGYEALRNRESRQAEEMEEMEGRLG